MAVVMLDCGHTVDADHTMGERLVRCHCIDDNGAFVEHVVAAVHTNAVTYEARLLHPEPEPEPADEVVEHDPASIALAPGVRLVDVDHAEAQL